MSVGYTQLHNYLLSCQRSWNLVAIAALEDVSAQRAAALRTGAEPFILEGGGGEKKE